MLVVLESVKSMSITSPARPMETEYEWIPARLGSYQLQQIEHGFPG